MDEKKPKQETVNYSTQLYFGICVLITLLLIGGCVLGSLRFAAR